MTSRRNFIKKAAMGTAALTVGGVLPGFSAKSYSNIIGANDKIRVGAIGVNSRGMALATNFAKQQGCEITRICDVDSRAIAKCITSIEKAASYKPKGEKDLRKMVESKDVDAVSVATPDHLHACSVGDAGVPFNFAGFMFPAEGSAYAGIILRETFDDSLKVYDGVSREYIQAKLIAPLQKDKLYCVKLSYANSSKSVFIFPPFFNL